MVTVHTGVETIQEGKLFAEIRYMGEITSNLAKKSEDPPETPRRVSPGGLRTISPGTTLLVHTVVFFSNYKIGRFEKNAFFESTKSQIQKDLGQKTTPLKVQDVLIKS